MSKKRIDSAMNIKNISISEVIYFQKSVNLIMQKCYSLNKERKWLIWIDFQIKCDRLHNQENRRLDLICSRDLIYIR